MNELVMGNEAVALGALKAGMTFYAAYPITPASEIMHFLADREKDIVFIHAEDEIASVHMAIGGSLAGHKALTSTSGPGMSLKQEGIGLAQMMEVPMVVVNVQRVGPSTGMPTLPAQGDIIQARHGSHGDYNPLVFYPWSVEECFLYTIEAFNAAERSLSPVILLMDGFLAHLSETVDLDSVKADIVPRTRPPLGEGNRHFTGLLARDGVPKTKDPAYYREWYAEKKRLIEETAAKHRYFDYYENKASETLIIAYGITARVVWPLRKTYAVFRPIALFPMLENELKEAAGHYKNIVVIEMNDGQYAGEVQRVLKRDVLSIPILGGGIKLNEIRKTLEKNAL
jgi:2-oxoglutarate ferredoxin oxidoreductase subunit alpha